MVVLKLFTTRDTEDTEITRSSLFHICDTNNRLMQHCDLSGAAHKAACHRNRLRQIVGAVPAQHCRDMRVLSSSCNHLADMLAAVLAPVPHEKRMRAVLGIPAPVHLNVTRIVCKLLFVLVAQHEGVASFRQKAIEELDVTGMKSVIKLVVTGMMDDQHATFLE